MAQDCKKCIHYDSCVQQFRDAKANGEYDCITEEEYFSFVDSCPCTMYLDNKEYGKWISVDDPNIKPRHLQEYIIAFVFDDSDMIFYSSARYHVDEGNGIVAGPHFSNEGVEGMRVKYWMPIPKLPSKEEE